MLQRVPENKIKIKTKLNLIRNSNFSTEHNLNIDTMIIDKMQTENQTQESSACVTKQSQVKVTYLEIPVKSENDMKEYRVIQLENGLTALLIADLHSFQDGKNDDKAVDARSTINEEEDDEDTDSEEDEEEESEEESEIENNQSDYDKEVEDSCVCTKHLKREEKMCAATHVSYTGSMWIVSGCRKLQ